MRPEKNRQRWERRTIIPLLVLGLVLGQAATARGDFDPKAVFDGQCSACHTVGQGDDVGPDLAGVTERRDRDWLIAFVRSSQTVIRSGDAVATELYERYGRQTMPDHDYTPEEIEQILAYIEAGGPRSGPALRLAETATPEEIDRGRLLFIGKGEASRRVACASCHTVSEGRRHSRKFLGGSLAGVFSKYQDVELATRLEGMRSLPALAVAGHEPLTTEESFCLRAFLRSVDVGGGLGASTAEEAYPFLGFGSGLLLIAVCGAVRRKE